jgi:hypothetical protein
MFAIVAAVVGALLSVCKPRASLVVENLALRQQLAVLRRKVHRPHLHPADRAFWFLLSRIWSRWTDALAIVRPATVIAWQRRGFARFWTWKSRRLGRPPLSEELVQLIEKMARDNPLWSRRRIASELAKLGHAVGKDTVAKYMPKPPKLDHLIVLGERHLLRAVREYVAYYNGDRPHMSLDGDAPVSRPVEPPTRGKVVALPRVGGLHHRYARAA